VRLAKKLHELSRLTPRPAWKPLASSLVKSIVQIVKHAPQHFSPHVNNLDQPKTHDLPGLEAR
jgi:hypothetical protein